MIYKIDVFIDFWLFKLKRVQGPKVEYEEPVLLHMRSKYCPILMKFKLKPAKWYTKLMHLSTFDHLSY